jgi:transcriptional regulator with XRE-family HTH domain
VPVNERLRDAMQRAGLSADNVAEELKVDAKTVERWITQGRSPYPKYRGKLAATLRETERYLWPDAFTPEWRPPRWCATGSVTGEASCRAATA